MTEAEKRREKIIVMLEAATSPLSAGSLAQDLNVSRQVIVGDVALLRASGKPVSATPRGYVLEGSGGKIRRVSIVCLHSDADTAKELEICVDHGCRVIDVTVEHPVYGQLTGLLDIASRYDVDQFMKKLRTSGAHALLELTDGVHIHTLEYTDDNALKSCLDVLAGAGFLYR